jgi:dTDP-4-amino-4,6-dideoxygalactose transaminase
MDFRAGLGAFGCTLAFGRPQQMHFVDVASMNREAGVAAAVAAAVERTDYIQGAAVARFAAQWAEFCGTRHCVPVGSGTDALILALQALGLGAGDDVLVPANTFIATPLAVAATGARPVFVDVDPDTLSMQPWRVAGALTPATRGVIVVHLTGRPVDVAAIQAVLPAGLWVLEDAAQSHGAADLAGVAACYSFYPSKNLGALGDAGAVVTNDAALARRVHALANYGSTADRHVHEAVGRNSRMDTLQAAVLLTKLPHLRAWNARRAEVASWYRELLPRQVAPPADHPHHVYHLFVVQTARRDELRAFLEARGIPTGLHYPTPCHRQPLPFGQPEGTCPDAERAAARILSLPMCPSVTRADVAAVCAAIAEFWRDHLTQNEA